MWAALNRFHYAFIVHFLSAQFITCTIYFSLQFCRFVFFFFFFFSLVVEEAMRVTVVSVEYRMY